MRHPFEGNTPPEEEEPTTPEPCPECGSTRGYSRVGEFRVQCLNCNSLIRNSKVKMDISKERS